MPVTMTTSDELTAVDRCDRCNAQAYVRAHLASGVLLFCGHHARSHRDQLLTQALRIDDQTHRMAP